MTSRWHYGVLAVFAHGARGDERVDRYRWAFLTTEGVEDGHDSDIPTLFNILGRRGWRYCETDTQTRLLFSNSVLDDHINRFPGQVLRRVHYLFEMEIP